MVSTEEFIQLGDVIGRPRRREHAGVASADAVARSASKLTELDIAIVGSTSTRNSANRRDRDVPARFSLSTHVSVRSGRVAVLHLGGSLADALPRKPTESCGEDRLARVNSV